MSATLLECHRDLCELTWLAWAERLPMAFSDSWDARAVLGIEAVRKPTQPLSPSSLIKRLTRAVDAIRTCTYDGFPPQLRWRVAARPGHQPVPRPLTRAILLVARSGP